MVIFSMPNKNSYYPIIILYGPVECTDTESKARFSNDYFNSPNLTQSIHFFHRVVDAIPAPFLQTSEIDSVIQHPNFGKACPPNDISHFSLKDCCHILNPFLFYLMWSVSLRLEERLYM